MTFAKKWSSLSALILLAAVARADPALQLALTGPETVTDVNDFNVVATLKNTGDVPLKLYNEPTGALSKTPTRTFKVAKASDNSPASFTGMLVKYGFDRETSFTDLAVGESVDVTHNLASGYQFDSEGTYRITPSTTFYYVNPQGKPTKIEAELQRTYTAKVGGNLKSRAYEKRMEHYKRMQKVKRGEMNATTTNCTPAQSEDITESIFYASAYVASAEKYLSLHNSTTDRYDIWFGAFSETNHALVSGHYNKIRQSDLKTYTYDCECDIENPESTYAYVFPDTFGHVYLCGSYMAANVSGTDSKAGTLVHEATHFTANGGTEDLGYGHELAAELAQTNATAACMNADSHEYFAENANPWLA